MSGASRCKASARRARAAARAPAAAIAGKLVLAAGLFLPALCSADIYGWVDQFGNFTYSNMPPPKGARVTDVIPEEPAPSAKQQAEAARQREVDALNERVQMLELERTRQMQAVDYPYPAYPAYPGGAAPSGGVCESPEDQSCDWLPYYFTGGIYRHHPYRGIGGQRFGAPSHGGGPVMRGAGAGGHAR